MDSLFIQNQPIGLYALSAALLLGAEMLYFKIADRYSIIDKPNNRSSHTGLIIRGGGVIFAIALLIWVVSASFTWMYFMIGAMLVASISFIDDIRPQRAGIRFIVHFTAISLLLFDSGMFTWPIALWMAAGIISIGALNAFNFMDGINGITGVHALVNLATFAYIQSVIVPFTDIRLIALQIISVLIFLFFNFRAKAKCFAGDVGSVTLAFVQIFLLMQLIVATDNLLWVIVFLVFGIDAVITILYRLKRKENIFKPHRTHLYQYLSNEYRWPHRAVALLYGGIQLLVNGVLIYCVQHQSVYSAMGMAVGVLVLYAIIRYAITRNVQPVTRTP